VVSDLPPLCELRVVAPGRIGIEHVIALVRECPRLLDQAIRFLLASRLADHAHELVDGELARALKTAGDECLEGPAGSIAAIISQRWASSLPMPAAFRTARLPDVASVRHLVIRPVTISCSRSVCALSSPLLMWPMRR
jgi:hypothetical protein